MTDTLKESPTTEQEDVRALITVLHQDRQVAKEKARREGWTQYVSLMIVGLAVATAIGSLKSAGFGSKVMLNQSEASGYLVVLPSQVDQATADGNGSAQRQRAPMPRALRPILHGIKTRKRRFRRRPRRSNRPATLRQNMAPRWAFAIASLQISIALASVCLITKRKLLWGAAGLLGIVGIVRT